MATERISHEAAEGHIRELLREGYIAPQIRQIMSKDHKISFSETNSILTRLGVNPAGVPQQAFRQPQRQQYYAQSGGGGGMSNKAIMGLVIMIIGCAVTFFSYQAAASSSTGGTYVVAWGAIIFGGLQFLRGLAE